MLIGTKPSIHFQIFCKVVFHSQAISNVLKSVKGPDDNHQGDVQA